MARRMLTLPTDAGPSMTDTCLGGASTWSCLHYMDRRTVRAPFASVMEGCFACLYCSILRTVDL